MQRMSLKARLIATLSIILVFGFVLTNLNNYRASRSSVRHSIVDHALPLTRDNIYSEIQADLMRPIFISSLMANDTFLKDWALDGERDVARVTRYLQEIQRRYGFFSAFFVSEKSRNYYHFNGILKQLDGQDGHDAWYENFKSRDVSYDLEVDTNQAAGNRLTVFINHRLEDYQGNLLGVTGVGLNMEDVAALLKTYRQRYDREIYLVDSAGLVKMHNDPRLVDRVRITDQEGMGQVAAQVLADKAQSGVFEVRRGGRHVLLTARYIPEFEWFLLVEQDETKALSGLRRNLYKSLLFDLLIIGAVLLVTAWTVNRFQNRLEEMATIDKLTGVCNRREFDRRFEMAVYLGRRQQAPFSVILFDVDDFKAVNDRLGHLAGDHVLKEIAGLAADLVRHQDVVARWGGDEFIVLVYGELSDACEVAERLREEVRRRALLTAFGDSRWRLTISCGVVAHRTGETLDQLMVRVDRALYTSKQQGKDCTVTLNGTAAAGFPDAGQDGDERSARSDSGCPT